MTVIDASVVAKLLVPESHSREAFTLLTETTSDVGLIAPQLLPYEIANTILQRIRRGVDSVDVVATLMDRFDELPITLHDPHDLTRIAFDIALTFQLRAVYDAHYVALARIMERDLWTADERLVRALSRTYPFVKWIGSYPAGNLPPL
jgi:predicted nucleic acid-binding protein